MKIVIFSKTGDLMTGDIEFDSSRPIEEILERVIGPALAHLMYEEKEKLAKGLVNGRKN